MCKTHPQLPNPPPPSRLGYGYMLLLYLVPSDWTLVIPGVPDWYPAGVSQYMSTLCIVSIVHVHTACVSGYQCSIDSPLCVLTRESVTAIYLLTMWAVLFTLDWSPDTCGSPRLAPWPCRTHIQTGGTRVHRHFKPIYVHTESDSTSMERLQLIVNNIKSHRGIKCIYCLATVFVISVCDTKKRWALIGSLLMTLTWW